MQQQGIELRRFETPDQRLDMKERGGIFILEIADGSTGMLAIFEPGWTWEDWHRQWAYAEERNPKNSFGRVKEKKQTEHRIPQRS